MRRLPLLTLLSLGACAALPTTTKSRAEDRAPAVQRRLTAVADLAIEAQLFQPAVPWPQWDCNWDHRELDSRGRRRSLLKPSGAPRRHLILIRHGQTTHNKLGLFTGWEDASLAKEGIAEATRAGQLLRAHGFAVDAVYTSWRRRGVRDPLFMIARASARLARRRRAVASRR